MATANTPSGPVGTGVCLAWHRSKSKLQGTCWPRELADLVPQFTSFLHLCLILLCPSSSSYFKNLKKPWSLPCMTTKRMTHRSSRYNAMRSTTCWTVLRFTGGEFRTGTGKVPSCLLSQFLRWGGNKENTGTIVRPLSAGPRHWVRRGEQRQKEEGRNSWRGSFPFSEVAGRQSLALLAPCTPSSTPSLQTHLKISWVLPLTSTVWEKGNLFHKAPLFLSV